MEWELVIGLEVHAQLKTKSKLFSGSPTAFGALPNSQASFIDAALPGVLPVLNQEAVYMAIQFGLATNAHIHETSIFERKNYFYPDLPKGYQISQYQNPIITDGTLDVDLPNGQQKIVHIARAHLEEDAGKSIHNTTQGLTGIDLNRAGTPLLEIVTTPCLSSADEAIAYLKTLHQLVRFLGICDGNMQEGSFRCDVNVSVKPKDSATLGVRTEIKNMNSFRFIEKAIQYELNRHIEHLERGQKIIQETRLYNPDLDKTYPMREKENENDYRYFPDPDLLPITVNEALITQIKETLPELPVAIENELIAQAELNSDEIQFLLSDPAIYAYFCKIKKSTTAGAKLILNWLKGTYSAALNEQHLSFENAPIPADVLSLLLNKIQDKSLSNHHARSVFNFLWSGETDIEQIIKREDYSATIDEDALKTMILDLIKQHPSQVEEYRAGKEKLFGFFVGQLMKLTKGQANPEVVSELLKIYLT